MQLQYGTTGVSPRLLALRLAGRGEKIHEKVCRCGGRVPIREVWRARRTTATTRTDLGVSGTPGTWGASRLERDKAKLIEERDHWKRRSEHLEKELEAARRAGRRQRPPSPRSGRRDAAGVPGGEPGRSTGSMGVDGSRHRPTRHTWRRPRRAVRTAAARSALDRVASQYQEDLPAVRPSSALRHRGGPLLAVSAARAPARAADLRRVGRGCQPNWVRTSPRWSSSCTPSWACRWRRSSAFCGPSSDCT